MCSEVDMLQNSRIQMRGYRKLPLYKFENVRVLIRNNLKNGRLGHGFRSFYKSIKWKLKKQIVSRKFIKKDHFDPDNNGSAV